MNCYLVEKKPLPKIIFFVFAKVYFIISFGFCSDLIMYMQVFQHFQCQALRIDAQPIIEILDETKVRNP